nr:glutamate receptor 2.2 [Quercus suber]
MDMAIKDLYAHANHQNFPILHVENSRGDPFGAASFAKTLIEKKNAKAILGFGTWQEAVFVAQLGNESRVPILSLANEIPQWASCHWPFLVNAARSQNAQMKAVAAIIQSWKWRKVNIIYEDMNPAVTGISPELIAAIQGVDAEINDLLLLSPFPRYPSLSQKLESLKNESCRVFIVHTSITLATKIFTEANNLGMMDKDYVWITTNAITSQIDSLNASIISSMQGVLGVKSYFSTTPKSYKDFHFRFRIMFRLQYPGEPVPEPGTSAMQAYDTAWAVAIALVGKPYVKSCANLTDHVACMHEMNGPQLLEEILQSNFEGLTGAFNFKMGKLAPIHIFRIVNVVGKSYRELGFWSEGLGFSESIHKASKYNRSMSILGQVFWPGGPWSVPNGWGVPIIAKPLKIGVPAVITFSEFVNVRYYRPGAKPIVNGFSIAVFEAALELLPYHFPYEFIPFNGTYDSLVQQVYVKTFDAVVGDIAIIANRSEYAEFPQPYSDSGEKLHSNLSRMTMVVCLFVALVITQSFTASLTSLLTVQQLDQTTIDIETLKKSGAKVGCDANSFVVKYLEVVLGFQPNNIRRIGSGDYYPQALKSGEIAAAFLEAPYVKVFLAKYCEGFTTSGPAFKVGGFGFAFPRSSPYLPDISEAVLKLSESGKLRQLEHSLTSSYKCSASNSDDGLDSLGPNSFWGLFVITGGMSTIALLAFIFRYVRERWYRPLGQAQAQHHHTPSKDELWMFAPEIWYRPLGQAHAQQHHAPSDNELWMFGPEMENQ